MPGDIPPPFVGIDQHGKPCILLGFAGQPVILFFYPSITGTGHAELLRNFEALHQQFTEAGAVIIGVGLDSAEVINHSVAKHHLSYHLLSAHSLQGRNIVGADIVKRYGALWEIPQQPGKFNFTPCSFLIDENSRIKKLSPITDIAKHPGQVLEELRSLLPKREVRDISMQAPVLLIDNVLTKAECDYLIHVWHTQGNVDSGSMRTINGQTVGVYDYDTKIRRDHFIADPALVKHIDTMVRRRVFPQIKKAFHFDCTHREDYKIACYDAERGGYFRRHRDNTTAATAHRIWAMSLNLNSEDYDGGYLKFPEFSDYRYKPTTGSAIIFSGSMMHEATDVSNGKRFVLLQFFYDSKHAEIRAHNRHLLAQNTPDNTGRINDA
jgi:peroxiredoxin